MTKEERALLHRALNEIRAERHHLRESGAAIKWSKHQHAYIAEPGTLEPDYLPDVKRLTRLTRDLRRALKTTKLNEQHHATKAVSKEVPDPGRL